MRLIFPPVTLVVFHPIVKKVKSYDIYTGNQTRIP